MEVIALIVLSLLSVIISIGAFILNELVNDIRDLSIKIDILEEILQEHKND